MDQYHAEFSALIDASPMDVYAVLSDYRTSHSDILPKAYFTGQMIERGGAGTGTIVETQMNVYGIKQTFRLEISEPEPGRVLVETDAAAGVITTFIVDSLNQGTQSRVTIATNSRTSPGIRGFIEKLVAPTVIRRIYQQELELLAEYLGHGL